MIDPESMAALQLMSLSTAFPDWRISVLGGRWLAEYQAREISITLWRDTAMDLQGQIQLANALVRQLANHRHPNEVDT